MKNLIYVLIGLIVATAISFGIAKWIQITKNTITKEEQVYPDNTDRDYTTIRHEYRIGIKRAHDQTIFIGYQARKRLKWNKWPDVPFLDRIPQLPDLPQYWIWVDSLAAVVHNPEYDIVAAQRGQLNSQILADMQSTYPQLNFVLMAYNPVLDWFEVPDQYGTAEMNQWINFVHKGNYYITDPMYDKWEYAKKLIK